jgi:bifunctional non-homologous end joining protein LigD
MSGKSESITIGSRKLTFSNLDKPLYPTGFTKGDVIDYYGRVADAMLPLLKGRAVTLKRYPNGTDAPFFFEKRCPPHKPDWVKTADVVGTTGTVNHCLINDVATLLWAANLAAIEFHVPMALASQPGRPIAMVFDLDPGEPATLMDCLRLGLQLKKLLADFNLECLAKTSGSKGLHIYVPLNTATTFDRTKTFARAIANRLVRENPDGVTATMSRSLRKGKIFVDWSQNDAHKTTVCVYSLRAKLTPTVSTPLAWSEIQSAVKSGNDDKLLFDPAKVLRRLAGDKNSFSSISSLKQKLPAPSEPIAN